MPRAVPAAPARRLALASLATMLGASLTASPAGGVAVEQRFAMPAEGTFTIVGHGFGHGHGMSQYGAEGAARQGKTWQQIVGFYYPGTTQSRFGGKVRVLISADTTRDVVVAPRTGLKVRNTATGEEWLLPANGASRWRLDVASDGRTTVSFRTDTWHRWRAFRGDGAFRAGGRPITLYVGSLARRYRGTLIAASPSAGSTDRDTVNQLGMDGYIKGVIPREMPATWSPHAVRAQAVAARTYAAYEAAHPRARHYQLCDTTSCQVYGGYDAEHPASNDAVAATAGVVLTSGGQPAFTQFGSSSGGWTSANQFGYLPAQADAWDRWAGNPHRDWTVTVDVARIERLWPKIGNLRAITVTAREGGGDWQGRVWSLELEGGKATVTVSGSAFRAALGLKSTYFTVS